jgi:hypothetical protein
LGQFFFPRFRLPLQQQHVPSQRRIETVIKKQIVRGSIAAAAVLVPVAGFTAIAAGPAAAVAKGITCSKLSGSANTSTGAVKTKLSGCNGNTGGSGKTKGTTSDTSETIKWVNGKSTTGTETATAGSGCTQPGAVTEVISGNVTADNTKSTTVGAPLSATVCAVPSATNPSVLKLSLLSGTKFVIGA